jgi:hypothetical protein
MVFKHRRPHRIQPFREPARQLDPVAELDARLSFVHDLGAALYLADENSRRWRGLILGLDLALQKLARSSSSRWRCSALDPPASFCCSRSSRLLNTYPRDRPPKDLSWQDMLNGEGSTRASGTSRTARS